MFDQPVCRRRTHFRRVLDLIFPMDSPRKGKWPSLLVNDIKHSFQDVPTLNKLVKVVTFAGIRQTFRDLREKEKYGFVKSCFLIVMLPSASGILRRIKEHVIDATDDEVANVKKSFAEDFAMLAVAGAILAQVAMTGYSLGSLDETHWTAIGAFTVALVTGALTVVHSCLLQQRLNSLFGPQDLRLWLSQPADDGPVSDSEAGLDRRTRLRNRMSRVRSRSPYNQTLLEGPRRASLSAVFIINVPAMLLYYSVIFFLAGLGIYVGSSWSRNLDNFASQADAMRVMILYIVTASIGLLIFFVPVAIKMLESTKDRQARSSANELDDDTAEMKSLQSSVFCPSTQSIDNGKQKAPVVSLRPAAAAGIGVKDNSSKETSGSKSTETQRECVSDRTQSLQAALAASIAAQERNTAALRALLSEFQSSGANS
ncbi:uncharacterized protein J3D65DRAFT_613775 [Phyllosticta citribraziliensis]|uniref:Uncharacterized protein n=1 Tax=Phyllosticta citribraziliensis TaxID=989973 RepID=A0ABR1M653_9PEZI